jgi:NADPH-dependent 2,4-dienoyl-CoA reductase/sulfur reductase-like enzyme
MVVGAGPTGIELAGELGAAYPHVPIKLVTNKYEVGAGMPKPVKAALQAAFQSRPNVSFVTGERGSILDSKRHGCDVVFMCAGMEPNTSFLGGGALKASLDEKGFIKTGATGRVLVRSFGFNSRMDSVWGIRLTTSCSTLNLYHRTLPTSLPWGTAPRRTRTAARWR